jgi:hypothetical protein
LAALPEILGDCLRQWFEMLAQIQNSVWSCRFVLFVKLIFCLDGNICIEYPKGTRFPSQKSMGAAQLTRGRGALTAIEVDDVHPS